VVELALSFPRQKYLPAGLIGLIAGVHMPWSVSEKKLKIDGISKALFETLEVKQDGHTEQAGVKRGSQRCFRHSIFKGLLIASPHTQFYYSKRELH
jgi:hypothetical protein